MTIETESHVRKSSSEDSVDKIVRHAGMLSSQLKDLRERMYPPEANKSLRKFMTNEVSRLTLIPESTLRTMDLEGRGPSPARLENNHRAYALGQINELRQYLAEQKPSDAVSILPPSTRRRTSPKFWRLPTLRAAAPKQQPASISRISWPSRDIEF